MELLTLLVYALIVAGAYLLGGIPFGVMIARLRGVDIRERGSGNIGATNVARVLGTGPGLVVLVLDAGKGALAAYVAQRYLWPQAAAIAGFAAIYGHCASPFLGGKGGKGVATALGVFAVLAPQLAIVGAGVAVAVAGKTRVPALGSLAGGAAAALVAFATHTPMRMLALATFVLLVYTHRGNLAKLTRSR